MSDRLAEIKNKLNKGKPPSLQLCLLGKTKRREGGFEVYEACVHRHSAA